MILDQTDADEIHNLLTEFLWLVEQEVTPETWRIFGQVYNTRGDAMKAAKRIQRLLERAQPKGEA